MGYRSRHAYVANVGDDTAYEVSVTACDRVIGRASSVPPYRADRLSSSSELPCYVNFCVMNGSSGRFPLVETGLRKVRRTKLLILMNLGCCPSQLAV
jgi:hypothetical protein